MARFHCLIRPLARLFGRHAMVSLRTMRALQLDDQQEEPGPHGPGWFDSSWELVRGLDVREGLPGNAGLNEWLAVCLRDDAQPGQRGLRATSRATASPTSITAIA